MQLPSADELVLVSGIHPILAKKVRYFEDRRFRERILPPPSLASLAKKLSASCHDDWSALPPIAAGSKGVTGGSSDEDLDNAGIRREPTLPEHEAIAPESPTSTDLFAILVDEADDEPVRADMIRQRMRTVARQAASILAMVSMSEAP